MANIEVNLIAVLVCAMINMVIGMSWYSQSLFGKTWMKLSGINPKKIDTSKKKGMGKLYFLNFLAALLMMYILAHFVGYTESTTWMEGMQTGLWIWLGFIATTMLGMVLWEGKPFKLYLINSLYYLVTLCIAGAILASW